MSASLPAIVPLLVFLAATPVTAQPAPEAWDTAVARLLELTADNAGQQHPVRVSPDHLTNLVFNAQLLPGGVVVEDERWVAVAVNEARGVVTLLPSGELPLDRPLTVTVRFADGAVPGSVTFRLVVHPTRAEQEVRVYRKPRSGESYRLESLQERERAERCEEALALERTRVEGQRPESSKGLFDTGLVGGGQGVEVRNITADITQRPGEALEVQQAYSYRAQNAELVAVELEVENKGPRLWTAEGVEGAELVSTEGVRLRVLHVWPSEPLPPGKKRQLTVVAEATAKQLRGSFLLRLGEANGPRTITVKGVVFPGQDTPTHIQQPDNR
ncbi:DUF2381 family protein [Vitiosangium sp. GDMCC 1.1324]|uniref:DUF2381 family protein n=1 Tax=Vitiosangium sp. (strain GDMCC 1.1324) TaxID=2138576 RepID=UPI00130DCFE7|nr:DUF2381 family protein [Vitiosangium sp. GDMCC 1.1324]